MPLVLIATDADAVADEVTAAVEDETTTVLRVRTGVEVPTAVGEHEPDLVVLDLGLPDVDGTQVLSMIRAVSTVPVIIATARDDDPTLVAALDAGADDYVVKPFTTAQLEARIRAVLRRAAPDAPQRRTVAVGGLVIDVAARRATLDGEPLDLSPREHDLLLHLAEGPYTFPLPLSMIWPEDEA